MALDIAAIRRQFPILGEHINGKPLVYLDNAATTQKPQAVLDAMTAELKQEDSRQFVTCTADHARMDPGPESD